MSKKDLKTQPVQPRTADAASAPQPSRIGTLVVWGLMAAYVAVYLTISLVKWRYFLYDDFDLAVYAQGASRILHGSFYSSILGVNILGNHMSLLMVPMAPIYAAVPSAATLLVVQTVVLALGALPVYWLAQRELRREFLAVCCAALYLLYPALGYSNLYQFHPETLTATTLLFTFHFLWTGRFWWMTLFAALSLLAKEDVPLVVGAMGLYALVLNRPRRWVYSAALLGLAGFFLVLAFGIVMPSVNRGEVQLQKIYEHWGPTTGEALKAMTKDPPRAATELFSTPGDPTDSALKREYYLQMLLPVGFLALLSPLTLAIALPAVAQHLLSQRVSDHTIVYHYTACVTPFVIVASVLGLRNLMSFAATGRFGPLRPEDAKPGTAAASAPIAASAAVALAVLCQFLFGPLFGFGVLQMARRPEPLWPSPQQRALAPYMHDMLTRVPADGAVASGFRFMPYVAGRKVVYSVHHVYKGTHTMSDKPYDIPEDVVAMVLDADSPLYLSFTRPDGGERLRRLIEVNRLAPAMSAGDSVLFLRDTSDVDMDGAGPRKLWEAGDFTPELRRRVDYNSQLAFLGSDRLPTAPAYAGGKVPVRTLWRRIGGFDPGNPVYYYTQFALFGDSGAKTELSPRRIGYTIYPVHDWPISRTVAERYEFVVPADVPPGSYTLALRVIEERNRAVSLAMPSDRDAVQALGFLSLGKITVAGK